MSTTQFWKSTEKESERPTLVELDSHDGRQVKKVRQVFGLWNNFQEDRDIWPVQPWLSSLVASDTLLNYNLPRIFAYFHTYNLEKYSHSPLFVSFIRILCAARTHIDSNPNPSQRNHPTKKIWNEIAQRTQQSTQPTKIRAKMKWISTHSSHHHILIPTQHADSEFFFPSSFALFSTFFSCISFSFALSLAQLLWQIHFI